MSRWSLLLVLFLLVFAVSAHGQGFIVNWFYLPENGGPLTTVCDAGVPIADGYPISIMWDADSDGPDPDDALATLCIDPPNCEQGPAGTVNYNTFQMNGSAMVGLPGYFIPEAYFTSAGGLPSPSRFYLRVYEPDGITPLWTSIVYELATGFHEYFVLESDWVCGPGGAQCVVLDEQE